MTDNVDPKAPSVDTLAMEEAPQTGLHYGRQFGEWKEVTEEAKQDFKTYGRNTGAWVEISGTSTAYGKGLSVDESLTPQVVDLQPAGPTPLLIGGVYVTPRDGTTQSLVVNMDDPATGELKGPPATDLLLGALTEPPPDGLPYARKFDTTTLPNKWIWEPTVAAGLQITGLIPDNVMIPSTTPVAVTAYGAEFTPTCVIRIDGVDVVPPATIDPARPTTAMFFTIDPTPELVGRIITVTVHDPAAVPPLLVDGMGAEPFEFQELVEALYRGRWQPATNTPDIVTLTKEDQWMWVADIVDPTIPEVPLVALPGIDPTIAIKEGDHVVWDETSATFLLISSGALPVHYGQGLTFDDTTRVVDLQPAGTTADHMAGVWVPPRTELQGLEIDPNFTGELKAPLATSNLAGSIIEPFPDGKGYVRMADPVTMMGMWVPPAGMAATDFGTGLALDETAVPQIVHLTPAGDSPATLGGVYVIDRVRNNTEGLELGIDGRLRVPLATNELAGAIVEPPPDDMGYVRRRDTSGVSAWVPPADTPIPFFGLGLSHDDATLPGTVNLQPAGDGPTFLGGVYVIDRERNVSEGLELGLDGRLRAPLATPRLAGTIVEPEDDGKGYVRTTTGGVSMWVPPADTPLPSFGLGLALDETATPQQVNLTPAGWAPEFLGGVYTVGGRSATEGLDLAAAGTGQISVPLATDLLAGSIVEPPPDGQKYVRERLSTGVSQWVHAAAHMDYRVGLHEWFDAAGERLNVVDLKPATTIEIGGIYEAPNDGVQYVRQFEQWERLASTNYQFRIGLTETGSIVDLNIASENGLGGITEPPADRGFYVRTNDGVRAVWVPAGSSQQPQRPAGSTVSTRGVVYIPPDQGIRGETDGRISLLPATGLMIGGMKEALVDGKQYARKNAGWEEVTGGAIDYGVGLTLDDTTTPNPTVNLDVANFNGEIGGITVVARSPLNGLEYDITTGTLWAPLATNLLPGVITEPVADGKGYVRASQPDGSYQWVPPAPSGGGCTISDTPPLNPVHEDLWWESDSGTMFIYYDDGTSAQWVQTDASPEMPSYGIGIDLEGGAVNLKPANFNNEIGGVKIVGRGPTQGLEYDNLTGTLWAPLATDKIAGSFIDAPKDGKLYARANDAMNGARWTETTSGGVLINDSPPTTPMPGALWFDSDSGALSVWYEDIDSTQWVQVNGGGGGEGIEEAPIDGVPYSRRDAGWVATTALAANPGDLKHGFQANDHSGWVKLDGRAISTLTTSQQAIAVQLGFTTNLPSGVGSVFMMHDPTVVLGTVVGSMSKNIEQGNLPAVTLTVSNHDPAAVTSSNHDPAAVTSSVGLNNYYTGVVVKNDAGDADVSGAVRGRSATGGTGYYFVDAEGVNVKSIEHTHTVDLPSHNHTVDLPGHNHTVQLNVTRSALDITPKAIAANAFVFLGS